MQSLKPIKFLSAFMGIYHIIIGILGTISGDLAARIGSILFGAQVQITPQFSYLTKYLGAYVIAFGLMMLLVAKDPIKYSKFINVAIILIIVRIFDRLFFAEELKSAFGIEFQQSIVTIMIIGLLAVGLYYFKPKQ